jgi:hypothetical protein
MQPLKAVISALRRELEAALQEGKDLPHGTRLEAARIVLSLELSVEEHQTEEGAVELFFGVSQTSAKTEIGPERSPEKTRTHTLTLEFKCNADLVAAAGTEQRSSTDQKSEIGSAETVRLEGAAADCVLESLVTVFGAPGFDSSARATVFREALGELSHGQALAVVRSLSGSLGSDTDEAVKRAWFLISALLRSGPLKSTDRGRVFLAKIFSEHSVQSVIHLIEDHWKSQAEWLDEPRPPSLRNGENAADGSTGADNGIGPKKS